jgi:hypothetical protein
MTSLPEHTGRPDVGLWLRGWVDELPQTTVVWRPGELGRVNLVGQVDQERLYE